MSSSLYTKIDNPIIKDLINNLSSSISELNTFLEPLSKEVKHSSNKRCVKEQIPYASFKIDKPPITIDNTNKPVQLSFEDIIKNNYIKPIKRRKPLNYTDVCPHCNCKLFTHHKRNTYNVLVCSNNNCSFYIKNKKKLNNNDYEDLKTNSGGFKLRYTFRLFNFTFNEIKNDVNSSHYIESKINIDKIHHSKYVLGLILTYYVNYGLSSRKTSQIMREIHGVKVSYQTVINYAEAAAKRIEKLNEEFDYSEIGLSDTLTGDETYIKVAGKTNYVFFFSDTKKKIITSYRIFPDRDSLCAIKSIYQSINKYKYLPEPFSIVTDDNPIYNAAQVFFKMNNINFDLYQVIGLKNKDNQSKTYRSYKQVEERLNRTYKFNYYGTNGYSTLRGANIYMVLFVGFFNFLRKHSSLNNNVPI